MRWARRLALFAIAATLIWAVVIKLAFFSDAPKKPALRSKAGDFRLSVVGERGRSLSLSELAGKGVLLNFWATWCEPCKREMPVLARLHERYAGLHFTVVGVTDDKRPRVERWLEDHPQPFPVLYDPESRLRERFGAEVLPYTVYVGPDGRVAGAVAGTLQEPRAAEAIERLIIAARALQRKPRPEASGE